MASTNVSALTAGPLGVNGLTSLSSLRAGTKDKDPAVRKQALAKVCVEVEGVFLSQLMQQMRQTYVASVDPKQKHTDYSQLYEQQVSRALAAGGGIGLARRLYEAMQNHIPGKLKEKENVASRTESASGNSVPTGDLPVPGTSGLPGTGGPGPGLSPGGEYPKPGHD